MKVINELIKENDKNTKDISGLSSQLADIVKYEKDSNIDLNGNIHPTLKARLEADNVILLDRMNNANYLPYEAQFITASNSYHGLTKELVVKGRTLQNLLPIFNNSNVTTSKPTTVIIDYSNKNVTLNADGGWNEFRFIKSNLLKDATLYTITFEITENTLNVGKIRVSRDANTGVIQYVTTTGKGRYSATFTTNKTVATAWDINEFWVGITPDNTRGKVVIKDIMLLEGDYTNKLIPSYFEGIKSVNDDTENMEVVSYGKNLVNLDDILTKYNIPYTKSNSEYTFNTQANLFTKGVYIPRTKGQISFGASVKTGTVVNFRIEAVFEDRTFRTITYPTSTTDFATLSITSDVGKIVKYIRLNWTVGGTLTIKDFFIKEGVDLTYEPYTEHRVPLKMKNLRGLPSGVADTSDGVRRIGKVVLNGNEAYTKELDMTNYIYLRTFLKEIKPVANEVSNTLVCDKMPNYSNSELAKADKEGIATGNLESQINIVISKSKLSPSDVVGFKAWLKANPITVYYELATPTTEEGNTEELRTYDGQTNIFTENSLIEPTISAKVLSNIQAVVSTLRMETEALNNEINTLQVTEEENNLVNIEISLEQDARLTMLELGL